MDIPDAPESALNQPGGLVCDSRLTFQHAPMAMPEGWLNFGPCAAGIAYKSQDGLRVVYSVSTEDDGRRWVHVSMSRATGIPNYKDQCEVKRVFIGLDKLAIQLFVPESEHVNIHTSCLHLWHCLDELDLPDFTRGSGQI